MKNVQNKINGKKLNKKKTFLLIYKIIACFIYSFSLNYKYLFRIDVNLYDIDAHSQRLAIEWPIPS